MFFLLILVMLGTQLQAADNTYIHLQDFDFSVFNSVHRDKRYKNVSVLWGNEFTTHSRALGGYFSPLGDSTFYAGDRRGEQADIPKVNMVATEAAPVAVTLKPQRSVRSMYLEVTGLQAKKNIALSLGASFKEVRHELNGNFDAINDDQRARDRFSEYLHGALEQQPPNGNTVQSYLENNKFYDKDKRVVGIDFLSLTLRAPWQRSAVEVGIKLPGHRRQEVAEWLFSPTFACQSPSIFGSIDWSEDQVFGWEFGVKMTLELQAAFVQKRSLGDFEHAWSGYQLLGVDGQNTNFTMFTPAANVFTVPCSVKNRWKGEMQFLCQKILASNFIIKMLYGAKFSEREKIEPDVQNFTKNNYGFVDTVNYVPNIFGNDPADFDGGFAGSWIRPNHFALQKSSDKAFFLHSIGLGLQAPSAYGVTWHLGVLADFDLVRHERNKIGFFCEISRFFA